MAATPAPAPTKSFNSWNSHNRDLTPTDAVNILRPYGWHGRFRDFRLLARACVHKSYVNRPDNDEPASPGAPSDPIPAISAAPGLKDKDNEELEFLGDRVVGLAVSTYLCRRYAEQGEGFLNRVLSRIVNNKQLGKLAKAIGLAPWVVLSRHMENVCDGRNNLRILGSMFEAWIGALYLQEDEVGRGFQVCSDFLVAVIEKHIDFVGIITEDTNYKDQLLRLFQTLYHESPRYKELRTTGPPHDRIFTVGVVGHDGTILAESTARNKKIAEQEASRLALEVLLGTPAAPAAGAPAVSEMEELTLS